MLIDVSRIDIYFHPPHTVVVVDAVLNGVNHIKHLRHDIGHRTSEPSAPSEAMLDCVPPSCGPQLGGTFPCQSVAISAKVVSESKALDL